MFLVLTFLPDFKMFPCPASLGRLQPDILLAEVTYELRNILHTHTNIGKFLFILPGSSTQYLGKLTLIHS